MTGVVRADLVVVETMPDCHRASHRAARNWGQYPMNGAKRTVMERCEAEDLVAADEDGYDHIVRDATAADLGLPEDPDDDAACVAEIKAEHAADLRRMYGGES